MSDDTPSQMQELQVDRSDLHKTRLVTRQTPELADGEILLSVDKFALTANNVTYAVAGDQIGYWQFFPAGGGDLDPEWGIVPAWGLADVVASRHDDVPVGDRLYGYVPMATHLVIKPAQVRDRFLVDAAAHRTQLPPVYNGYSRTNAESAELRELENERCLFFPLFMTSYFLYDYLRDNDTFGASQVVLGSASSKTAFGLAKLLHDDPDYDARIVGLTSPSNIDFVRSLGSYDDVVPYENVGTLDSRTPTVFVDMAGSSSVTHAVHEHFGDRLEASCRVGATHWNTDRSPVELPGPEPEFFFAPGQIQKREAEWGPGVAIGRANEASVKLVHHALEHLDVSHHSGPEAVQTALRSLLANDVLPSQGLLVSMHERD